MKITELDRINVCKFTMYEPINECSINLDSFYKLWRKKKNENNETGPYKCLPVNNVQTSINKSCVNRFSK